jgi:hypothetical protein
VSFCDSNFSLRKSRFWHTMTSTTTTTTTTAVKLHQVDLNKIDERDEFKQQQQPPPPHHSCQTKCVPKPIDSDILASKIRSLSSSSTNSSINTAHNLSSNLEEDEERFYDAIEAELANLSLLNQNNNNNNNNNTTSTNSNISSNGNNNSNNTTSSNNTSIDLDMDERFFDTKTSRHASEMSESSVLAQLSPRSLLMQNGSNKPMCVFEIENDADNDNDDVIIDDNGNLDNGGGDNKDDDVVVVVAENVKEEAMGDLTPPQLGEGVVCDEDNEEMDDGREDAELETAWSFWIDRYIQ